MSLRFASLFLLLLPSLLFATSKEYTLTQLKQLISKSKSAKMWTLIHTAEQDYDQHYISSLPSYTHRIKERIEPTVVETTITILSQKQCRVVASSLTEETKHEHSVKVCGDWEGRGFACEMVLPNGDIANIVYSISYSFLHCGDIYVHDKNGNMKTAHSFDTKDSKSQQLHTIFASFIDTTCYGNDCMNGYCFSFRKPGLIRMKESWAKMIQEREEKWAAYREERRIAELQHQFKCMLLPHLNHLNSFDTKTLSLYKDRASASSRNAIPRMIYNLQQEAAQYNCTVHWSERTMQFYFQVPKEIAPIYRFEQ